jgi:hypothetical protein
VLDARILNLGSLHGSGVPARRNKFGPQGFIGG